MGTCKQSGIIAEKGYNQRGEDGKIEVKIKRIKHVMVPELKHPKILRIDQQTKSKGNW